MPLCFTWITKICIIHHMFCFLQPRVLAYVYAGKHRRIASCNRSKKHTDSAALISRSYYIYL